MKNQAEIKEFLDKLSSRTAVLSHVVEELGGAQIVAVPCKRLNTKPFPLYVVQQNGMFVVSDMGHMETEFSQLKDEDTKQKIVAFCKDKALMHGIQEDENGMFHTQPSSDIAIVVNKMLGFQTVVFFALDAAL